LSLTAKDVAEILRLLEESRFDELDLEMNGVKIQLRRGAGQSSSAASARNASSTRAEPQLKATAAPVPVKAQTVAAPPGAIAVPSPLLGIFYRAPKPGEPPFIEVGQQVKPETIVGIIEVMKLMNTVRAGVSGEVVAIPARNGELVEFDETLLFVRGS
jgi:acetyl-CoA carboxylase biotin carboxyl carrier protein